MRGVNAYLEGYAPLENVRFRRYEIAFSAKTLTFLPEGRTS
ncbi:MAG: hypothetical protein QXM16_01495 [Nitrososphaerota archaeon]